MKLRNPWIKNITLGIGRTETVDSPGRLELLAKFDREKLQDVIAWSGTQKTVREAAERRLRKLTNPSSK